MSPRDFKGDMQAETEALLAWAMITPEEWLKQLFHCRFWDWVASICHPQLELVILRCGPDHDWQVF